MISCYIFTTNGLWLTFECLHIYLSTGSVLLHICLSSGWLLIAEVRSRLDPNTGGADPDKFSEAISQLGFSLVSKVCIYHFKDFLERFSHDTVLGYLLASSCTQLVFFFFPKKSLDYIEVSPAVQSTTTGKEIITRSFDQPATFIEIIRNSKV